MKMRNTVAFWITWLLIALSGCDSRFPGGIERKDALTKSSQPRVVVGVVDSGLSIYHQFYYAGGPNYLNRPPQAVTQDVLDEFGIAPNCIITLTRTGDFAADYQADVAHGEWAKADACMLVWFQGTNVIASALYRTAKRAIVPDDKPHATGISAALFNANPEAILFFVEAENSGDPHAQAEKFIFAHPSVDIISGSYDANSVLVGFGEVLAKGSFDGVVKNGKLHFHSCPNEPYVSPLEASCGFWWTISIGGFEENAPNESASSSNGRQVMSGNLTDFVADWTQTLPYCKDCEDGYLAGTAGNSFGTPRSAGIASRILLKARRSVEHVGGIRRSAGDASFVMAEGVTAAGRKISINNWQLRRALEVAAWVPSFGDFNPAGGQNPFGPSVPIPPVAPWLAIGWGVISDLPDSGVIEHAEGYLGLSDNMVPVKDAGFCVFQAAVLKFREIYWNNIDSGSESSGYSGPFPVIPCM